MNNLLRKSKSPEFLVLIAIFLLFIMTAPFSVQTGDTGELVTNSFYLRVIHPPGYPLWTLLYHVPIKYLSFTTPFHAASIFTVLISCLWLSLLLFRFRNKQSLALITVLASSLIFWRYSILPDVFSLHLLFLVGVFLVFLNPKLLEKWWVVFLVSLSVTNHHLIIFAFPLYLHALIKNKTKKSILLSLGFGLLSASLYFLLLTFNTSDYGAWGNLNSLNDVLNHFLRVEYGTFKLQSSIKVDNSPWFRFYLKTFLTNSWSLIIAAAYLLFTQFERVKPYRKQMFVLIFCILAYFLMFYFGDVMPLDGLGETIFERFLLQPILFMFFIVLFIMNIDGISTPQWLVMTILINAGLNISQNYIDNNYRNNTVIEDFVLNSLNSLPLKSIYLTQGDNLGNASYYAHDLLKIRQDIMHVHPNVSFKWSLEKLKLKYPGVFVSLENGFFYSFDYSKHAFFMNTPPLSLQKYYGVRFFGVLYEIFESPETSPGVSYDCSVIESYRWRERTRLENLASFENSHIYDLEYGRCYYGEFFQLYNAGKKQESKKSLEKAVQVSSLSVIYTERLCHLYRELKDPRLESCDERLGELISFSNKQYYFYKYDN